MGRMVISLVFLLAISMTSCGRKDVNRRGEIRLRGEKPISTDNRRTGDFLQRGIASWYGNPYHGRRTANGETYDMWKMTAAHKTLPFGTVVRVDNHDNGQSIQVRINDRGPFIRGRIIDLSREAAKKLGMENAGTADVSLYLAKSGQPIRQNPTREVVAVDGYWTLQMGSFKDRARARALVDDLRTIDSSARIEPSNGMHRVRVGKFKTKSQAGQLASRLAESYDPPWIVFVEK